MKKIVDYLQNKHIIFKSLKEVLPKEIGSRKNLKLYVGVDLKSYYASLFCISKKSRFLRKEAQELILLHEKLEKHIDSQIKKKYLIIEAPLCSKARAMLEAQQWKVWHEA
ncbi:MAG: hypothetical protein Q9M36_11580 [Sulfurovum sp.]|nr:hypothetical protein [Sulfurovum sp.]